MKKNAILAISFTLVWSGIANAINNAPESCPSVGVIKAIGPQTAFKDKNKDEYFTYAVDNYGTEFKWNFLISQIKADSTDEALEKGKRALHTLNGNPLPFSLGNLWFCMYSIDNGYSAVALEPSFSPVQKARELARKIKNK